MECGVKRDTALDLRTRLWRRIFVRVVCRASKGIPASEKVEAYHGQSLLCRNALRQPRVLHSRVPNELRLRVAVLTILPRHRTSRCRIQLDGTIDMLTDLAT
jgi:hypothetical protein